MAERWNLNKMDKHIYFRTPLKFKRVKPHCMRDVCFFWFSLCVIFYFDASLWQANANLALGIGNLRAAASGIKSVEGGFVDPRSQQGALKVSCCFFKTRL